MGLRCLYSYALFRFYQTPPLWSHLSKGHFSWYVCSGGTLLTWAMQPNSFYKEETFTWQPFQANPICHFLTALLWTLIFIIITEACRVWDVAISLSIAQSDLGLKLSGLPLLRRLLFILKLSCLWMIFLTAKWWTSKCLEKHFEVQWSRPATWQNFCFYRFAHTCWKPVNQLHLISSTQIDSRWAIFAQWLHNSMKSEMYFGEMSLHMRKSDNKLYMI